MEKIDFVVGFLNQSSDARKLSEAELISNKITEFIKLNGLKKQSFIEIMRISQIRMNDEENPVMNSLINSIIESF